MEYQWIECYSTGTNRTIGTNGRVDCTPTQPEAIGNILSLYNKMHFTNGTPTECVVPLAHIVPLVPMDK